MKFSSKILFVLLLLIICGCLFGSNYGVFNLLSISVPGKIENQDGEGISDVDVSLYCLDMSSGREILFFSGNSQFKGELILESQTDTNNLPEQYAYKLLLKSKDFELEKVIDGNPDQNKLLSMLNPIVIDSEKSSSLFESTWSASLDNIAGDKYRMNAYMQNKALVLDDVVYLTVKCNVEADVYLDNKLKGKSPLELTLQYKAEYPVYYIRLFSEGYEEKTLVIDLSKVNSVEEVISLEEYVELLPIE